MKRFLTLAVCLLLLFAMTLSASAQELPYIDAHTIRNTDAVSMLTDLELLQGNHKHEFNAANYLTRAEVAKLAALIIDPEPVAGTEAPYYDISRCWAKDYISFCYERGFLAYGTGAFNPDEPVTARTMVKMLLGAVGYDLSAMQGWGWETRLDELANELRVYNGYELDYNQPITRDYAARLILNVLNCNAVIGY